MTVLNPSTDVGSILQALGDPTRRRMVEALGQGAMSVSALARPFDMSLTAVVQHLHVLEQCGLVKTEKVGRVRSCQLEMAGFDALALWIEERRPEWHRRLDRLANLLGGNEP